jgi:hypothetical protein
MTEQIINTNEEKSTMNDIQTMNTSAEVVPKAYLVSFILITLCFPLWGF